MDNTCMEGNNQSKEMHDFYTGLLDIKLFIIESVK